MVSFPSRFARARDLKTHKPLLVAISMMIVAQLGVSLYLPALPRIASLYTTSESAVAMTLYAYLCFQGLAQILFAVFYVKLGFIRSVSIGFILFSLGGIAVIFSPDLHFFTFSRSVQGFGGGVLSIMIRVLIKDQYRGKGLNTAFSYLSMFAAMTPALAPFLGALLIQHHSWKHLFVLMSAIAVCVFFSIYYLGVTLTSAARIRLSEAFKEYPSIVQNKRYVLTVLARLLVFTTLLIYLSGSPFLFITRFGLSPKAYGYLMMFAAGSIFVGSSLSAKQSVLRSLKLGQGFAFLAAVSMGVAYLLAAQSEGLSFSLSMASIVWVSLSYGLLFPNITAAIVRLKASRSGADVALAGAVQLIGASLINFAVARFHGDWRLTMGILFLLVAIALPPLLKACRMGQLS